MIGVSSHPMGSNAANLAKQAAASSPPAVAKKRARKPRAPKPESVVATNGFTVTHHLVAPMRTRGYVLRAFPSVAQALRLRQLIGQGLPVVRPGP